LRKYLIAALAAVTVIAFAGVSFAQAPAANMTAKVTPTKVGTKKKPKNSTIKLSIENTATNRTMSKLTITTAKTFKLSTKGLTKCDRAKLDPSTGGGPDACPKASIVGTGTATALLGVTSPTPSDLEFDVTPVVTGPKNLDFYLAEKNTGVNVLAPGTISGRKLTIEVPTAAQQPVPGVYAGLVSLETTLKAKKGKNFLASTTGCSKKKHPFSAKLTFVPNGSDTTGGTVSTKANAKCSK
jgi:hypothetical protein